MAQESGLVRVIQHHFIWAILLSYVVAAFRPELGLWIRSVDLCDSRLFSAGSTCFLPSILLGSILFNAGLGIRIADLNRMLRRPFTLAGGVFGNLATPLLFIIAASFAMQLWHNPVEVQQILAGLALVASMPIAGASTAWSQNADGDLALSLGLVLVTTALSPFTSPAVLHAVGFVTTGDLSEDLHELATNGVGAFLGTWVILPSLLGIAGHWTLGEHRVDSITPYMKIGNYSVLILLNYSNASLTLPGILSNPDIDFLVIMLVIVVGLCVAAFTSGYLVAQACGADHRRMASLVFGLGMNNNGTGLVLASLALSDHPEVMLPVIFYNLTQHLVAALVDYFVFRRRQA